MSTKESWEWELWRHPEGHCYYLKVWPMDEADYDNVSTPGAELTVIRVLERMAPSRSQGSSAAASAMAW